MVSAGQARSMQTKGGAPERRAEELSGKRERTRQRIFEATFKLIGHERGLSVRIEEICAEAGVSRGTFYNYFSSMEELFQVLAVELSHDFNQAVIATLSQLESRAERTNAAIQHYLKRARRDPAWGWAMAHLSAAGPFFGAETYEACYSTVEQGIKLGEFDLPNAQCGRDLLMGTVLAAMVSALRGGGARSQPRVIAHHVLRAFGVPDARASEIADRPLPEIVSPK
jgi:AcrR family transcriptional regulator